ncbi:MAG: 16S rRNA (uracil(1498)-N(3))-methyltransferase [Lentisphaerales bacterium]|jgi:16S rRNA (uracil1498-N3)-methyltransferase|nr:MAG: 16S rRNA (uracil(1498)-N(3))-methyltransferase [Lentisphaerales bacterium]
MIRCYLEKAAWADDNVDLSPSEAHHLLHVFRAPAGEMVTLFDGCGREATAELIVASKRKTTLRIVDILHVPQPNTSLTLMQALPKSHGMDQIIQGAVELGVTSILPIITERTIVRLKPEQAETRRRRWDAIAISAAKQCGSAWLPEIGQIRDLAGALASCDRPDLFLVPTLEIATSPIREVLDRVDKNGLKHICCLIGPEGDLTVEEVKLAREAGAVPAGLGSLVLRTETAALYMLSVLGHRFRKS